MIENFKNITKLNIECKKINIIVGKPNTGKSNLLESLSCLSMFEQPLAGIRFNNRSNLFTNSNRKLEIRIASEKHIFTMKYKDKKFVGNYKHLETQGECDFDCREIGGMNFTSSGLENEIKFYRFKILKEYRESHFQFLFPPHGDNLITILMCIINLCNSEPKGKIEIADY